MFEGLVLAEGESHLNTWSRCTGPCVRMEGCNDGGQGDAGGSFPKVSPKKTGSKK